jgi:hypothetical protein
MAICLQTKTGLPLHGLHDAKGLCHHAFVYDAVLDMGIDARGTLTIDAMRRGCGGQEMRPLDINDIERVGGYLGRPLDPAELRAAERYARSAGLVQGWRDQRDAAVRHTDAPLENRAATSSLEPCMSDPIDPNAAAIEGLRMAAWEAALGTSGPHGLADRIAEGMDVNAITHHGHLPLARAARCAGAAACRLLVAAGAEVNAINREGMTPLHAAIAFHQYEVVDALIDCGARTNYIPANPPEDYLTPFQLCVSSGRLDEVEQFVALGEDLAQRTLQGKTLLQLAASDMSMRQLLRSFETERALNDAAQAGSPIGGATRSFSNGPI